MKNNINKNIIRVITNLIFDCFNKNNHRLLIMLILFTIILLFWKANNEVININMINNSFMFNF
jgi:hypothetical protein